MSRMAKAYAALIIAAGLAAVVISALQWESVNSWRCLWYVALSALAGQVKLRLPGMEGTYSPGALIGLVGLANCAFPEVMLGGLTAAAAGSLLTTKKRPAAVQVAFNLANVAVTIGACVAVIAALEQSGTGPAVPVGLACVAATHFVVNTMVVSGILSLVGGKPLREVAGSWYMESFQYFLAGSALLVLVPRTDHPVPPEAWLFALGVLWLVHFLAGVRKNREDARVADPDQRALSPQARVFVALIFALGLGLLLRSVVQFETHDPLRFLLFLAVSLVLARLKVRLPGLTSTISLHFVIKLMAVATLTLPEALLVGATGALAQAGLDQNRRIRLDQLGFNAGAGTLSTLFAFTAAQALGGSSLAALTAATALMYASSTLLVGFVVCLSEARALSWAVRQLWSWSLAYYAVGAAAAALMVQGAGEAGWGAIAAMLPLLTLVFVSFRLHLRA